MSAPERTAQEWFDEAARSYLENHQGCAWCGGSHRVFHSKQGARLIYYCHGCDFQTVHDPQTNQYTFTPGLPCETGGKITMYEI